MKFKIYLILLICSALFTKANADDCLDWFNESGLKTSDKECISKCNLYPKEMGTFSCSNECEKFCTQKKCKIDDYWKDKIKSGRPKDWDYNSEKTIDWKDTEKHQVLAFLSRLPDELKKLPLDGIYRMKKSADFINPGTTAHDGKSIILYSSAFKNDRWTTEDVLLHELGHVLHLSLSQKDQIKYKSDLNWKIDIDKNLKRPGAFISHRAKDNLFEDFAENFKFYILKPEKLKSEFFPAYEWFKIKYSNKLHLKKGCEK